MRAKRSALTSDGFPPVPSGVSIAISPILLVSRDAEERRIHRRAADELGATLIEASTGMYGLAAMVDAKFSLVLISDELVDLSVAEFVRLARRVDPCVRVVFTAQAR